MSDGAAWWRPGGYRTWTCASCGHHSIAWGLGTCPDCQVPREGAPQPEEVPAAPQPRARAPRRKPAARTGARAAKGG